MCLGHLIIVVVKTIVLLSVAVVGYNVDMGMEYFINLLIIIKLFSSAAL